MTHRRSSPTCLPEVPLPKARRTLLGAYGEALRPKHPVRPTQMDLEFG